MEDQAVRTKEDHQAREQFWSMLVRIGKQAAGEIPAEQEDLSNVPPHLIGRRRAQQN
jgi:hypothetical protein